MQKGPRNGALFLISLKIKVYINIILFVRFARMPQDVFL